MPDPFTWLRRLTSWSGLQDASRPKLPDGVGLGWWRQRVRQHGVRAAMNIGHSLADYESFTATQKREILPHLQAALAGGEDLLLDFGCGPGRFSRELAELTGAEVIGVDPVPDFLTLAPRHEKVKYIAVTEGTVPLPDRSVDVVFTCQVLGGLAGGTLMRSVREIRRVLRSGGLLFLVENTSEKPSPRHWTFRQFAEYAGMFPSVPLERVHEYLDLEERISVMVGRKR